MERPTSFALAHFLANYVAGLVPIDFFTVPTLTGRVLFVFVVLVHHRRRIVHFNITEHPTAAWTAQQITARGHISPSRRTHPRHGACRSSWTVTWSPSRKSADYIIATNDAQRDVCCRNRRQSVTAPLRASGEPADARFLRPLLPGLYIHHVLSGRRVGGDRERCRSRFGEGRPHGPDRVPFIRCCAA
jgi:hypothetical protein